MVAGLPVIYGKKYTPQNSTTILYVIKGYAESF